jgi:hypothetical protein
MENGEVVVTFCIKVGRACLDEGGVLAEPDASRQALLDNPTFDGILTIHAGGGLTRVEDELRAVVQNICFRAVVELLAGRNFVYRYMGYYGYFRMDPEGREVVLSGDFVKTARLPLGATVRALYECGERFLEALREVGGEENPFAEEIAYYREFAESAKAALKEFSR